MRLCGAVRELIEKSIESDGEMDGLKSIFSRIGLYVFFFSHCPTMQRNSTYHIPVYRVHCTQYTYTPYFMRVCVC